MIIGIVMLAAGNSRRFGSNKLIYNVSGKPMYQHVLEKLQETQDYVNQNMGGKIKVTLTVVTQFQEIIRYGEENKVQVLLNSQPDRGISSSLQIGLKANLNADAVLFCVADQPYITSESIRKFILEFAGSGKGMGCVAFGKTTGSPCIFRKKYYNELLKLQGDRGGKKVLLSHMDDVLIYRVSEEKELMDIDYREGYAPHQTDIP
ncbi:MAG: nucleotidyltransferase family protein [Blautia sp.]|nr:nucleotidyltransferase family protein [Blautia sp.]